MVVIQAVGYADGRECPQAGQYLETFDADAMDGRGFATFTDDLAKAMHFLSSEQAFTFWHTQSKVRPLRPDGKPNKPLTAYTVMLVRAPASMVTIPTKH